jgi:predicted GNAT family acetyltransferase
VSDAVGGVDTLDMTPVPTVHDVAEKSRYEIEEDGEPVGFLAYHLEAGEIALVHAEIDPAHGGRGLGSVLTAGALNDARRRGLRVQPLCPFVVNYIARHPGEYDELVAESSVIGRPARGPRRPAAPAP